MIAFQINITKEETNFKLDCARYEFRRSPPLIALGVLLLVGYQKRIVALLSGVLLLTFALSMLFFVSVKAPFDYSVFAAAACAFLLYKNSK